MTLQQSLPLAIAVTWILAMGGGLGAPTLTATMRLGRPDPAGAALGLVIGFVVALVVGALGGALRRSEPEQADRMLAGIVHSLPPAGVLGLLLGYGSMPLGPTFAGAATSAIVAAYLFASFGFFGQGGTGPHLWIPVAMILGGAAIGVAMGVDEGVGGAKMRFLLTGMMLVGAWYSLRH